MTTYEDPYLLEKRAAFDAGVEIGRLRDEIEGYKVAARDLNRWMQEARAESASLRERVRVLAEALASSEAWIDRWTHHVGSCKGEDHRCTCGRAAVLSEARAALSAHDEQPSQETK